MPRLAAWGLFDRRALEWDSQVPFHAPFLPEGYGRLIKVIAGEVAERLKAAVC